MTSAPAVDEVLTVADLERSDVDALARALWPGD